MKKKCQKQASHFGNAYFSQVCLLFTTRDYWTPFKNYMLVSNTLAVKSCHFLYNTLNGYWIRVGYDFNDDTEFNIQFIQVFIY